MSAEGGLGEKGDAWAYVRKWNDRFGPDER
jgi:hypothetical protein